jgi:flavin-binding protein dodecin
MTESVYKVIELIGTSPESWERAATVAVEKATSSLHDLRKAEVVELDMVIEEGKVVLYRAKIKISFKYHQDGE